MEGEGEEEDTIGVCISYIRWTKMPAAINSSD